MLNTASLVRLPDRIPLPVTSMTIATDADSWCWSLQASLVGPTAWALVAPAAPAYLPVEVEAEINGHVWRFLLDQPSAGRQFAKSQVALKGRSRSAWISGDFLAPSMGVEANPYTAQQLAEIALENTGWALDWGLPEWLVPGGLLSYKGSPMDRLIQLVRPVDGCLSTDPKEAIIRASLRYPTPAWEWDGEIPDLSIPEAALYETSIAPDYRPLYNGVYISGTTAGVLARCFVAGTAGDLLAEMVVDPLLCDAAGVAARARGVAVLSAAGPGKTIAAVCQLTPAGGVGPGLVPLGTLVEIGGLRGRSRAVSIAAGWSSAQGLKVRQSLQIERREVEA